MTKSYRREKLLENKEVLAGTEKLAILDDVLAGTVGLPGFGVEFAGMEELCVDMELSMVGEGLWVNVELAGREAL